MTTLTYGQLLFLGYGRYDDFMSSLHLQRQYSKKEKIRKKYKSMTGRFYSLIFDVKWLSTFSKYILSSIGLTRMVKANDTIVLLIKNCL